MIGKTLAHYEITGQLGKGGMGEVYQAKDKKLGRDVAIKILPGELAKDADRVARFQREAKVLASLNHPNIASIHGLEESSGTNFLVLELVEGETLADQIKKGPIPVEESLKLALQIAEALEAAHEKGVIHRDLKPANIKVTPDGKVKVLDFGLAKAFAGEQAEVNLSHSPTLSEAATMQGVILGTAAYMSPEQAKGKSVDKRADIWAFGAVLFEMLTGRQLFKGETVSETLAAVLMREPDFSTLPPNLHPRIRLLLERCLEKDVKNRYSSIGDARVDIQKALADPSGVFMPPITAVEPRSKLITKLLWVAALVLVGIMSGVAVWKMKPPESVRVVRFDYHLPEGQTFDLPSFPMLAVSPDGNQFIYSTPKGIFIRPVDKMEARLILGTDENPASPFFSPDGQWIGYLSRKRNQLKKIAVSGGLPIALCDTTMVMGAIWNTDNTIIYADVTKGIMRVSADGGIPELLIQAICLHPKVLPDRKSIIFVDVSSLPHKTVVLSLESREKRIVYEGGGGAYIPTGHLIYSLNSNLYAVPFNADKLKVTGGQVLVQEGVWQWATPSSGTLVYIPGNRNPTASARTLVWVDRNGKEEMVSALPDEYSTLRIAPDGKRVALSIGGERNRDIWILDLVRGSRIRLTLDNADDAFPIWTPDGKSIVFTSDRGSKGVWSRNLYLKQADGTGENRVLSSSSEKYILPWSWSRDGEILAVMEVVLSPLHSSIGIMSMGKDHRMKTLIQEKNNEGFPQISPTGRLIAYASNESGRTEIYVRPFPEVGKERWQVSTSGGNTPLWSPGGRELFYRSGDATMMVPIVEEPKLLLGDPIVLFRGKYFDSIGAQLDYTPWDISPDGKRFLMIKSVETANAAPRTETPRKINVVLNWLEELKQRVPVK